MKASGSSLIVLVLLLINAVESATIQGRSDFKMGDYKLDLSRAREMCALYPHLKSCQLARSDPVRLHELSRKYNLAPLPAYQRHSNDSKNSGSDEKGKRAKRAIPDNPCSSAVGTVVILVEAVDSATGSTVQLFQNPATNEFQYFAYFSCIEVEYQTHPCTPQTREFFAYVWLNGQIEYRQIGYAATCAISVP